MVGETPSLTGDFLDRPKGSWKVHKPPTQESAPEGPSLLVVAGEVTESQMRTEQVALFPLGPLPHIQHLSAAQWVAPPW